MGFNEVHMSRLDTSPPTLTFPPVSFADPHPIRRLIVLVPDAESDYTTAVHRIWELAKASECRVQLLGLCNDAAQESSLRRQLVTLSALVGDGNVPVESKIEFGSTWLNAVKSNWREGDVLVCFTEQRAGMRSRTLSQLLESNFAATIYVLDDLSQPDRAQSNWKSSVMAWMGSIGIILGFLWLQVKIYPSSSNWMGTVLLLLSIPVEIWLVWIWNSLFG
jgi:hypothetical protein